MTRRAWWWWRRGLIGAYLTLAFAPAAVAANPQAFGLRWAHTFNRSQARKHQPVRILNVVCLTDTPTVFLCKVELRDDRTGKLTCAAVAVGTDLSVFDAEKMPAAACGIAPSGAA